MRRMKRMRKMTRTEDPGKRGQEQVPSSCRTITRGVRGGAGLGHGSFLSHRRSWALLLEQWEAAVGFPPHRVYKDALL